MPRSYRGWPSCRRSGAPRCTGLPCLPGGCQIPAAVSPTASRPGWHWLCTSERSPHSLLSHTQHVYIYRVLRPHNHWVQVAWESIKGENGVWEHLRYPVYACWVLSRVYAIYLVTPYTVIVMVSRDRTCSVVRRGLILCVFMS